MSLLPRPRIRDITSERLALVNTSDMTPLDRVGFPKCCEAKNIVTAQGAYFNFN